MGCLHDPANVQQTSSKCIQNTRANAGRLLDRVNTLKNALGFGIAQFIFFRIMPTVFGLRCVCIANDCFSIVLVLSIM